MAAIAKWRETGRWWEGEPTREFVVYLDASGVRREVNRVVSVAELANRQVADRLDHKEDYDLRHRKLRDEKVSVELGYAKREDVYVRE